MVKCDEIEVRYSESYIKSLIEKIITNCYDSIGIYKLNGKLYGNTVKRTTIEKILNRKEKEICACYVSIETKREHRCSSTQREYYELCVHGKYHRYVILDDYSIQIECLNEVAYKQVKIICVELNKKIPTEVKWNLMVIKDYSD